MLTSWTVAEGQAVRTGGPLASATSERSQPSHSAPELVDSRLTGRTPVIGDSSRTVRRVMIPPPSEHAEAMGANGAVFAIVLGHLSGLPCSSCV
jgi:hypothetical protein